MKRHEFLKSIGFRGAALMAVLSSCTRKEDSILNVLTLSPAQNTPGATTPADTSSSGGTSGNPSSGGIDLSTIKNPILNIDLSSGSAANLKKVGGYITQNGIVVAQSSAGVYVAATQTCSHEPKKKVIFNVTEYYCTEHGARFTLEGKGENSFGSGGLTIYKVATDGKKIVIYS